MDLICLPQLTKRPSWAALRQWHVARHNWWSFLGYQSDLAHNRPFDTMYWVSINIKWEYKCSFAEPWHKNSQTARYLKHWEWKREKGKWRGVQYDGLQKLYIPAPVGAPSSQAYSSSFPSRIVSSWVISDDAMFDVLFAHSVMNVIGEVNGFL